MPDLFKQVKDLIDDIAEKAGPEADNLERIIQCLDTLYEQGETCIHPDTGEHVADVTYDGYRNRLRLLRPNSDIFTNVTASAVNIVVTKVVHDPPMTSINKANGTQDEKEALLVKWMENCRPGIKVTLDGHIPYFVISYKHDGVACALYYERGELVSAGLRPRDGINGEDVTANARFVKGIPSKLDLPLTCSIRGEIECPISVFARINGTEAVNGEIRANPRNHAAGSIRQFKDPSITGKRGLRFRAYSIEGLDSPPYKTEIERAKWSNTKLGIPFVYTSTFSADALLELEEKAEDLDYEVDGLVISVNDLEEQEQLGKHGGSPTGNPKGKLAWKFKDALAQVVINTVRWQVGRTGKITPVLEFDGVSLEGTTVHQCTAHNVGIVEDHELIPGTIIEIKKSGKIIPKFERVVRKSDDDKWVGVPDICPSCNKRAERRKSDIATELMCVNDSCPARNVGNLVHWLSGVGVKGISDSSVSKMVSSGVVKQRPDFYRLTVTHLHDAGFTARQSVLSLARIAMVPAPEQEKDSAKILETIDVIGKPKVAIANFLSSLGIPGAGRTVSRNLVSHFNADIHFILTAPVNEFESIDGLGAKTANLLATYFADNADEIRRLLGCVELVLPKTGKLTGKTFVFTGGFAEGKTKWEKEVEDAGGKVSKSVGKNTDYVIVGTDAGAKEKKAKEIGVPMLSLDDLKGVL